MRWYYDTRFKRGDHVRLVRSIITGNSALLKRNRDSRTWSIGHAAVVLEDKSSFAGPVAVYVYDLVMEGYPDYVVSNVPEYCLVQEGEM